MHNIYTNRPSHLLLMIVTGLSVATILCVPGLSFAQTETAERVLAFCDSGFVLLEQEEYEQARQLFEAALDLDVNSSRALLGIGRAWLELPKGGGRALNYLRRAVAAMPDNIEAHYYKALAHVRMSRTDIIGWDNSNFALQEIDKIIAINPSHPDAYYLRGKIYRDTFQDYERAIAAFKLQVDVTPNHMTARQALLKAEIDVGNWNEAIATADSIVNRNPMMWEAYPLLAAAYWKAARSEEAMQTFERYFAVAPEKERDLYLDLGLVLPPQEGRIFSQLDEEGRRSFWNSYWRIRDPNPKTAVNERLLEHFIRIVYARIEYGEKSWPWDDRGDLYVRYGEPDVVVGYGRPYATTLITEDWDYFIRKRDLYRQLGLTPPQYVISLDPAVMFPPEDGSATPEEWFYVDRGLEFKFNDPVMSGRYLKPRSLFVEVLERDLPTMSVEEDKIETFDPMDSVVTFKGNNKKTAVEYAFALVPDEFGAFRSATGAYATIDVEVNLYSESWELVTEEAQRARRLKTVPQIQVRGVPLFVDATRMEAEPGTYRLSTMLLDPETGKRATAEEIVELPDYSGSELMVSNILPAAQITQVEPGREGTFIRGNLEVLPLPGRALQVDQPLFIYYEIYNLSKDQYGATDYRVDYSVAEAPQDVALATRLFQGLASLVGAGRKRAVITSSVDGSGIMRDVRSFLEIDMSGLPPQTYELELQITDTLNGNTAKSYLLFRTLPPTRH